MDSPSSVFPFPVETSQSMQAGRFLVASRPVAAGEVLLRVAPIAVAVNDAEMDHMLVTPQTGLKTSAGMAVN